VVPRKPDDFLLKYPENLPGKFVQAIFAVRNALEKLPETKQEFETAPAGLREANPTVENALVTLQGRNLSDERTLADCRSKIG